MQNFFIDTNANDFVSDVDSMQMTSVASQFSTLVAF